MEESSSSRYQELEGTKGGMGEWMGETGGNVSKATHARVVSSKPIKNPGDMYDTTAVLQHRLAQVNVGRRSAATVISAERGKEQRISPNDRSENACSSASTHPQLTSSIHA